ncbi:pancreatic lipase-related protein 2-like [Plodia interpunctella]|uniref:pancreatic lipase-related protein 2-like n=1 Tax=Plodia interpunctella TaxID=58824 RepID=UPI0023679A25|nr:pancreatic lipase-related protein 2-like [Plodia interpunctella]
MYFLFVFLLGYVSAGVHELFDWNLKIPVLDDHWKRDANNTENKVDSELIEEIKQSAADNLYFLYTRKNPVLPQDLYYNNVTSIEVSNFNPNVPTVVIAHGWTGNQNANLNPVLRDVLLIKNDINVIVLDWCRLSFSNYVTSASGVPLIGQGLGTFLEFLNRKIGIAYDKMHLIGHSLGAHVVGIAGREVGGKVARITGLDPAGPLWHFNSYRITKEDAKYVEIIHTNAGFSSLGIVWDVGHVDFYPNGGYSQPGCDTQLCNHHRAWELLAATILYGHLYGKECESKMHMTLDICEGKQFIMGTDDLKKSGSGIYRLNTDMYYPYKTI